MTNKVEKALIGGLIVVTVGGVIYAGECLKHLLQ